MLRSLRKAETEVTRLEAAVVRWQGEVETKRAELAELRATAGARVFADETGTASRTLALEMQDLTFQIDGAEAATRVAEEQLVEARDELALARGAEKRDQAAKLTAEADAHQEKVNELLRQLTELDGATYVPEPELTGDARQAAILQPGGYVLPVRPHADVLRDEAATLLAEADVLDASAREKLRAREAAARPLVASAQLHVPEWDDIDSESSVQCSVSEGYGTATFEFGFGEHFEALVTLPDQNGSRSWSRSFKIPAGSGRRQIRCNGEVLAEAVRPGSVWADGIAHVHVKLDR